MVEQEEEIERQRALAMASARLRLQEAGALQQQESQAPQRQLAQQPGPGQNARPLREWPAQLDAMARGIANYGTFNQANKLAAGAGALTGIGGARGQYDANLAAQQTQDVKAQAESPVAYNAGAVFGVAANPANRFVGGAVNKMIPGTGILPRYTNAATQGAVIGAGQGAGFANPGETAEGAVKGAAAGATAGLIGRGLADVAGKVMAKAPAHAAAPSLDQIKSASQKAYKTAEESGVIIAPESYKKFTDSLTADLKGFHPKVTPGAANIVGVLRDEVKQGPITLETLDNLRSIASGASISRDANEARLAGSIVRKIDDFIDGLDTPDLLVEKGAAETAKSALKEARSLWRTKSKLQNVTDIVDTGEMLNDQNWVKGRFRALVKSRGFDQYTADEQKAIADVAKTGNMEKILKIIPWRGLQMTTTYAEPYMQDAKVNSVMELIARGGNKPVNRAAIFGHRGVPALGGLAALPLAGSPQPQANARR